MGNTENTADKSKKRHTETLIFNQYQYTDALMEEVQREWAKQSYINFIPLIIIAFVCAFFTWREFSTNKTILAILFAIVGVVCLIAIIASFISTNKRKATAIRQFHDTYHGKGFEYKITIEGDHIRAFKDNIQSADLCKSDVRGGFETERFYIFQLSGEQLLPLMKGAFIKGTVDACKNYIPKSKR